MKRDIIYVDDEPDNIVVFEAAFEEEFNILTATSGQETLDLLENFPVPVVVADQRMPEMSGVELFEIIRRRYPHIQRVILTGYSDPVDMIAAINKGQVFHFVKKPWERPYLLSVLIRAIEAHDLAMSNSVLTDRLVETERCALLGQATARITHEMGNQLCMLPLLELIEDKYADDEELVQVAQFGRQTYQRLTDLVNEVKTFMQFDKQEFSQQQFSLAEVVHELHSFVRFHEAIPHERFSLRVNSDPVVWGHKVKLQQVLINLIQNAAFAIRDWEQGSITLIVDREGNDAILTVEDTGCGISPDDLSRIWETFYTTKGKEGNGLGLDISRQIIEGHGGEITCESTEGVGTTFRIRLPIDTRANAQSSVATEERDVAPCAAVEV